MNTKEQLLSETICLVRERYLQKPGINSIEDIGDGWCASFSDEVVSTIAFKDKRASWLYSVCTENFKLEMNPDEWDSFLLSTKWNITPPLNYTWESLNAIDFGYHVWITCDGKHYDAETPQGVNSFFQLPFFIRYLN